MRKSDLLLFARRDWTALEELKADHWARVKRDSGPAAAVGAAEELRLFVRTLHPRWPAGKDRLEDLRTHIRVSTALKKCRPKTDSLNS